MNGKQHDERPTGQPAANSTTRPREKTLRFNVMSKPTKQRQPPPYLRDYLRTVHETARYSPTEIGCAGWCGTKAGQFWLTSLIPLLPDVNEENRI